MASETPLEYINDVDVLMELHEFMQDEQLSRALDIIMKLTMKPEVPSAKAIPLIVQLQAYAAKMHTQAIIYTTLKKGRAGTPENTKKQVYYAVAESLNKLVDALKYSAKYGVV